MPTQEQGLVSQLENIGLSVSVMECEAKAIGLHKLPTVYWKITASNQ
jgi:hypothetical protein